MSFALVRDLGQKNADCICNLRMQSAFVNQLVLNQV
ncbi:hypothetical protein CGSMWGv00703C2mash_00115 [Gardnerella pickettii 00703C2mash]|nr:hypothetical protein CGSMWGv00703C2mash_00115 [Gardnerella pickettii 00703C2mash]